MAAECELLNTCGFFKKYQNTNNLACKGFVALYCCGAKMNECKRKQYRQQNGKSPVDEMMPNGLMMK